jgi:hypothetical protein
VLKSGSKWKYEFRMLNWFLLSSKLTKENTEAVWEYPEASRRVQKEGIV